MFQSMFDRLLALFMVVILLVALIGGAFSMLSIRSTMVDSRMEALLLQAREIAFLAGQVEDTILNDYLNLHSESMSFLQRKAATVYQDFNAYILIVDRTGRVRDNMQYALQSSPNILNTLDADDVADALKHVLAGEEVIATLRDSTGPIFTVAVPYVQNNTVLGAVFIHTSAQIIDAEYHGMLLQIAVGLDRKSVV